MKIPSRVVAAGCIAIAAAVLSAPGSAQNATATQDGTAFANSLAPTSASQVVNPAAVQPAWSGFTGTPTSTPPNLGGFSNPNTASSNLAAARSAGLTGFGNQAVNQCANFVRGPTSDPLQVQACAAVNFLTNNCLTPNTQQAGIMAHLGQSQTTGTNCAGTYGQGVQNFNISSQLSSNDTIFTGMGGLGATASGALNPSCSTQTVQTAPPKYQTDTCEVSSVVTSFVCGKTLTTQCGYSGAPISSYSASKSGAFVTSTITAAGPAGMYSYNIEVPYRNCGGEGVGEIDFNLDTVGSGSYITINLSNLDDAAAVGVNNTTVFAGYPNAGPAYSGAFFPTTRADFQVGYSWSENVGSNQCVAWDFDGYCTQTQWVPNIQTFSANTKLLDYCPSGYSPTSQLSYQYCDPNTGYCSPISNYTPNNVAGFFCNAEGKFLMNKHEGANTWAGSVEAQMPLKVGSNKIQVYWGTGAWGDACGNVKVSGQIYNVAPGCTTAWDDQCAAAFAAAPPQ